MHFEILNSENTYHFTRLKQEVSRTFLQNHHAPAAVEDWKGNDISLFQEDLLNKVNARVSEKWFYTYFKNSPQKLPRIDMLNILSHYVGFENWQAFQASQPFKRSTDGKKRKKTHLYALLSIFPILAIVIFGWNNDNQFKFCFVDAMKNESITNIELDIKLLKQNQSPLFFKTDSSGCFSYRTKDERIEFIVSSPFHKTDTIIRHIDSKKNQTIELSTDDYALMLHYYTNGNVKDWKKHKVRLQSLIADDAQIYQLFDNSIGVELYSKDDFVRMLTIPTRSLKTIEILDKEIHDGKIIKLKFRIR